MKKNNNLSHLRCFPYAWQGLVHTFKTQKNMRLHSVAACAAIGISWYFNISKAEWLWVLMSLFFVMTTETINTAIEATVDLSTSDVHPLAKQAKDCAAGAVLLACLFSLIVASTIFIPKIKDLICLKIY